MLLPKPSDGKCKSKLVCCFWVQIAHMFGRWSWP